MDLTLTPEQIAALPDAEAAAYLELIEQLEASLTANPLQDFVPHSEQQWEFVRSTRQIVAAFAGNRFGKTHALVAKCLIQHTPAEHLPDHLLDCRVIQHYRPVKGRFMCPGEKALYSFVIPKFKLLAPRAVLRGGSWETAWEKSLQILHFADGGQIDFYTYQQDPDKLVGADLDYVAYDEPPPEPHRHENLPRLIDRNGREWFALTPVNMKGGGIGWIFRKIWKRREDPTITVVKASIYDNPTLDRSTIDRILAEFPEEERAARERGDFINFGGMIYPGGFETVLLRETPTVRDVRAWDVVVGIDPGLKNAAFIWTGFDRENTAFVFDEVLLQEKTPIDYARAIRATNAKWEIRRPVYVIDPSARNRSLVNRENVQAELARHGIQTMPGQNAVEAGVQQVRRRMQHKMLFVARECYGLRSEAEEYRMQDRPDGEFAVVKENDHRLDAMRYAVMYQPYYPWPTEPAQPLGWDPNTNTVAHAGRWLRGTGREAGPLGSFA